MFLKCFNLFIKEIKLFFFIPHDNSIMMVREYLNKSAMVYGSINENGHLVVSGYKLIYMNLLAFVSFLEIIKEAIFLTNSIGYEHIMRYIFVDCSIVSSINLILSNILNEVIFFNQFTVISIDALLLCGFA